VGIFLSMLQAFLDILNGRTDVVAFRQLQNSISFQEFKHIQVQECVTEHDKVDTDNKKKCC
jgi:hypothetical protein